MDGSALYHMQLPLFAGISEQEIRPMLQCINAYEKHYAKGEYIARSGDMLRNIGLVLYGKIQLRLEDSNGGTTILAVVRARELFGEAFVCGGNLAARVSILAEEDCAILFLPFSRVLTSCTMACEFHHRLIENTVRLIAAKNLALIEKLEIISKKTLREKILTYLLIEEQKHNSPYFSIDMGRLELADYLCADRSALTRELSRMRADGLIDYDKNTFRLFSMK